MKNQSEICVLRVTKNPQNSSECRSLGQKSVTVSNSRAVKPPARIYPCSLHLFSQLYLFSHMPAILQLRKPSRALSAKTSCCCLIFRVSQGFFSQDTAQAAAFQPGFFPAAELLSLPKVSFTPDPRCSQSWIEKLECLMCQSPALIKPSPVLTG